MLSFERHSMGQLMQVQRQWQELPAVRARACPTCPLHFTSQDLATQEAEEARWTQGLELMDQILESLGTVDKGWHGWVKAEDYVLFKEKMATVREQFLDQLSETEEDRPKWLSAWPFKGLSLLSSCGGSVLGEETVWGSLDTGILFRLPIIVTNWGACRKSVMDKDLLRIPLQVSMSLLRDQMPNDRMSAIQFVCFEISTFPNVMSLLRATSNVM